MKLVNIGFGNMVSADKILAVVSPESAPIKRIVQVAKENSQLIDATQGRKTKAVIITESDLVIISSLSPEVISARLSGENEEIENTRKGDLSE